MGSVSSLRIDRKVLISATTSARSRSSAVSRAMSSVILASVCFIAKTVVRRCLFSRIISILKQQFNSKIANRRSRHQQSKGVADSYKILYSQF